MTAEIARDEQGRTELMLAAKQESKQAVKKLLDLEARHRGDIFLTDHNGRTALFYAAERGDEEIIWALLSSLPGTGIFCARGALLKVKDNEGHMAEEWAKINGQDKASEILSFERLRIEYFE